jgi:hypothetical protein
MATTVPEPPKIDLRRPEDSGNGGWRNLVPANGDFRVTEDYSPPPSSTAIWVVLFAITMMFAAFTSALFVRKGSSLDWQSFKLPSILYLNTLVLIASSITLEIGRRRIATYMGSAIKSKSETPARWIHVTLFLGLLFVIGLRMAAVALRRPLSGHQSQQFIFLLADRGSCAARSRRPGRTDLCDAQAQQVSPAS